MENFTFLTDEHVPSAFTNVLISNDFDVITVRERYGQRSVDSQILDDCAEEARVVITNDRDFVRLAAKRDHAGIVMYTDRTVLLDDPLVAAEALADVSRYYSAEEMENTVEWLDNWV